MHSLDSTFSELLRRLLDPEALNPTRSDAFFYFVHDPTETLAVKRKLPQWMAALEQDRWKPEVVSMSRLMWEVVDSSGRWEEWLALEPDSDPEDVNEAVRDALRGPGGLLSRVRELVIHEVPRKVLLFTDVGLLHPYFRARTFESGLHDQVRIPSVLFYPGRRSGQYGLHFLGVYPEDGNYRSTVLGGLT